MISGIYNALSGIDGQIEKFNAAANNVANVSSTGYKSQRVELSSQQGGGVSIRGVSTNTSQGPILYTDAPGDLAISGNGFFQVEDSNGNTQYTRSGAFVEDAQGYLRTASGEYLVGQNGRVQIPANAQSYSVSGDGSVSVTDANGNSNIVNRVNVATFNNPSGLASTGNGLYEATSASGGATVSNPGQNGAGNIVSGALEGSNVDLVNETVSSMLAQRMVEANVKAIQVADEMLKTLTEMNKAK